MTAQIIQIGNRFYRIYGEGNAEYLLLQMTDEHELQSMGSEVAAIAQDTSQFLFAAVPVMNWNDELSPWKSPAVWGKQGFGGNPMGTLRFLTHTTLSDRTSRSHTKTSVQPPGRCQNHSGWLLAGRIVCTLGIHPDKFVLRYRRCISIRMVSEMDGV